MNMMVVNQYTRCIGHGNIRKCIGGRSMKFTEAELNDLNQKHNRMVRLKNFMTANKMGCGNPINGDTKKPDWWCGDSLDEEGGNEPFFCTKCHEKGEKAYNKKHDVNVGVSEQ